MPTGCETEPDSDKNNWEQKGKLAGEVLLSLLFQVYVEIFSDYYHSCENGEGVARFVVSKAIVITVTLFTYAFPDVLGWMSR